MRPLARLLDPKNAPAAILAASVLVLGVALISQYWGGLAPCKLCLYQRWPYAITIGLSLVALTVVRPAPARRLATGLCAVAFTVGASISFYHTGVEQDWFAGPASCSGVGIDADSIVELRRLLETAPVVRCNEIPWALFGISLAGYNFIISCVLAAGCLWATIKMERR